MHWSNKQTKGAAISSFEEWLGREQEVQSTVAEQGDRCETVLHAVVKMGKSREGQFDLFSWVMAGYPDLYKEVDEQNPPNTFLDLALPRKSRQKRLSPKKSHQEFVVRFLMTYPQQTVKLIQQNESLIFKLIPVFIEKECSMPIIKDLNNIDNPQNVDERGNSILHNAVESLALVDTLQAPSDKAMKDSNVTEKDEDSQVNIGRQLNLIQNILERCPDAIKLTNHDGRSVYQYRLSTLSASSKKSHGSTGLEDDSEEILSDKILEFLKEKIMHLDDHDDIIRLLHGKAQSQ